MHLNLGLPPLVQALNCCIPPSQPNLLQVAVAILPPMLQINLNFWGSLNFENFGHGSTSVMHPPIAQAPATQLPAPHTFEHVPSPLLRQCSVQEGVTRDSLVVGASRKNKKKNPIICPFKVH